MRMLGIYSTIPLRNESKSIQKGNEYNITTVKENEGTVFTAACSVYSVPQLKISTFIDTGLSSKECVGRIFCNT